MNKTEFTKIIFPICEYYGKTLSDAAIALYFDAAKEIDSSAFEHLVKLHLADPDQGKFFPTLAHIVSQASNETDIKRQAAIDFDKNPRIDGTSPFDLQKETRDQREARRRKFITEIVDDWKDASMLERVAYSERVPAHLKGEMLLKLGGEYIKALEVTHG